VVLGIDRLIGGFNPHTLADLTPISEAVAGLLLPSAFHPHRTVHRHLPDPAQCAMV
jgi:hypothetical protein